MILAIFDNFSDFFWKCPWQTPNFGHICLRNVREPPLTFSGCWLGFFSSKNYHEGRTKIIFPKSADLRGYHKSNSLQRPPTASEANQSTQNSQDMISHFRNGATLKNRTIFAISGWLVKKCLNRARIGTLWASGQGRILPLGNTGDLPWHFQALCWDFYVVKIKVRDVRK